MPTEVSNKITEIVKLKLKDIAEISSGATFRGRLLPMANAEWVVIQMKDLSDNNSVTFEGAFRIDGRYPPSAVLQKGDLVFRSRGQVNTAALVEDECNKAICAAPLIRIRPDLQKVIPEYLRWYINQPTSQNYLRSRAKGTTVQMISKHALDQMEILLPSMKQQKIIAEYCQLSAQEDRLLSQLNEKREAYNNRILMQLASQPHQTKRSA